jgi:hypothetical protein
MMQMRFSKLLLATSCLLIIHLHDKVHVIYAQNDRRNLAGMEGGAGGSAGGEFVRDGLLGMIMASTEGGTSLGNGNILLQNKIISDLPMNQAGKLSSSFLRHYKMTKPLSGNRFKSTSKYISPHSKSKFRLELDTAQMAMRNAAWFQFKGIDALKPVSIAGLSYDSNSSNQRTSVTSDSIDQLTSMNFNFNYGNSPGSSTVGNLQYLPLYRMNISGQGENEFQQQVLFQAGREFHRSALALRSLTAVTAAPLRELPGRTKTIFNRTGFRGIHDTSSLLLMYYEANHSITKRTETGNSEGQQMVADDVNLRFQYNMRPKFTTATTLSLNFSEVGNISSRGEGLSFGFQYLATARTTLLFSGGLQLNHRPDQDTRMNENYDFTLRYSVGAKTLIEARARKFIRPSFADNGIFLQEDVFSFLITQAIVKRWQARFLVDYYLREQDGSVNLSGLNQRDLGGALDLFYFINPNNTLNLSFSHAKLNDLRKNSISRRSNVTITWVHSF